MPSILVDIYKINDFYSGLGQFSYNFAWHISKHIPDNYNLSLLAKSDVHFDNMKGYSFVPVSWKKRYIPSLNKKYDLWHSLHQFPSHMPSKYSKHILTIHDLNFLVEKDERKANKYLRKLQKNIDKADAITVISDSTKQILNNNIDCKGKSIQTIYNGVELKIFTDVAKPAYADTGEFFFTLGVIGPKKNFHVLISMMKHFPDMKLIIAGNNQSDYAGKIQSMIRENNLEERVILPGKISDEDKFWLYSNCKAFLFPSIAEGFGLPVIEAMLAGKPVFLSKHTSLPEIGGDAAYYWDNFDADYMSKILQEKLNAFGKNSKEISEKIIRHAQKFSWQICIKQYLELYTQVLEN